MYKFYIANKNYSSWSLRPWILMRELRIPFEEHLIHFGSETEWAAYRQIAQSGKVPSLCDGETVVWDSLSIVEYLNEHHDGVWPGNPQARAWARSAAAEMHSGFTELRMRCTMNCGVRVCLRNMAPGLQQDLGRIETLWDDGLQRFGGPFLAGDTFSAVDACFAPVAFRIQTYSLALAPVSAAYAERLLSLPSMQQWYADALRETFRDATHEPEVVNVGDILLQDLRASCA
jgi:glutathione S-transferase